MAIAPAIDFMVMPMALLAVVVMPFGLEVFPLTAMKWGLMWMVAVAEKTASWSEGFGSVAMPPPDALLLMTGGFLWLALWRERWRLAGIVPIALALPLTFLLPRPAVLINEDGSVVAVRGDDGRLSVMGGKAGRFEVGLWLRADADARQADAPDLTKGVACDALGCTAHLGGEGALVALANRGDAFDEDCRLASIVVADRDAPPGCDLYATVIDRRELGRFGAHAFYAEGSGYRVETAYPAIRRPFMPPVRNQ
jgi:competence protein ComEC